MSISINNEQLRTLSPNDRVKFIKFGLGPKSQVPYSYIHHAFEDYAKTQPFTVAVQHGSETISYGELDKRANILAQHLIKSGVLPGENVGLFLTRSIDLVIGILAILKSGAAYVPQDARITPEEQLQYIKKKSKIKTILTQRKFQSKLHFNSKTIYLDEFNYQNFTGFNLSCIRKSRNCFILFTSGTTGMPNGVQVTHKNVTNILLTSPGNLGMRPGLKVSQILNISFDMSAWEILGALSNGATLVIRQSSIIETVSKVDIVISTPTILSTLDPKLCRKVKTVAVAGEPCPKAVADTWKKHSHFYNCCGPTETTIVNTMHRYIGSNHPISIGKPTPNNSVYILNQNLEPLQIGEVGEMWAGGDCVTAGYLSNSKLTDDRYKDDPFLLGGKMFKTRDLGRWNSDGELEHFGRTDDQVKIRGFRVELDSIATVLESIHGIDRATVLKLNDKDLAAFVASKNFCRNLASEVILKTLPYYCLPSIMISLPNLPMTARGKIDKKALIQKAVKIYDQERSL